MKKNRHLLKWGIVVLAALVLPGKGFSAETYFLPDTGQTVCYKDKGKGQVMSCAAPGENLAQDGSYSINPPSYTPNGDGTVFDNNTWLMWQQNDDGMTRTIDESEIYCNDLSIGGYTDWRLPNRMELVSIVDYGRTYPAIDQGAFPSTQLNHYWSSNHNSCNQTSVWTVNFTTGTSQTVYSLNFKNFTRCVRGMPLPYAYFVDNGNGTVRDLSTGLTWQQDGLNKMKWGEALNYCEGLSLGGNEDWRLPNAREIESLSAGTEGSSTPSYFFTFLNNNETYPYWSSTPLTKIPSNGPSKSSEYRWILSNNALLYISMADKVLNNNFVRCVRGTQSPYLDGQEVSVTPSNLNFWNFVSGAMTTLNFSVFNTGISNLIIGNISTPNAPFSIESDGCSGKMLSPLTSCQVTVHFSGDQKGTFSDMITIPSNDADHPDITVDLSGTAMSEFFLPDTGQATCYNGAGYPMTCPSPGEPLAQDGSYGQNPPSYTVNGDGSVTDNNTILLWQREDDGLQRTWDEAKNYCENLDLSESMGWRVPTRKELLSLIKYTGWAPGVPAIDLSAFPNAKSSVYWSSTPYAGNAFEAWPVNFSFLGSATIDKSAKYYVRCVKGEELPFGLFIDNGDATISDLATGLMWQQADGGFPTWEGAISYCETLSLGNYQDWRLPNMKELVSIIDETRYAPSLKTEFFPFFVCDANESNWSSTTDMYAPDFIYTYPNAFTVNLWSGDTWDDDKENIYYPLPSVRCVRNNVMTDKPEISASPSGLDFGSTETGGSVSLNLTLSNTGTGNLAIGTITVSDDAFFISSDGCSGKALSHSAACSVTVEFIPTAEGTFTGNVIIPSNDTDHPSMTVNLTGIAVLPSGVITGRVTDASTGSPLPAVTVTVTHSAGTSTTATDSNGAYVLTGLSEGSFTAVFEKAGYVPQTATGTLAAGETQTLDVQMNPAPALSVSITSPADGSVLNSSPAAVTGTVTNNASVTVNGIPAMLSNGTFTASIDLAEGTNTITASATDAYGQTASDSITVTLITSQPPVISSIAVTGITADSAAITWTTDQPADSLVDYGETDAYGTQISDPNLVTAHMIMLNGLQPATAYHFRVTSKTSEGISSSSGDSTFNTQGALFNAAALGDYGNVTVMEVTGSYDAGNPDGTINDFPRQEIAKEFYKNHADSYDFLVIFSNFDFTMPEPAAKAFYLEVKNDTQGIGKLLLDNSVSFGSQGKLQGIIDMGNIGTKISDPVNPGFENTIFLLAHESLHRWGASVRFKEADGSLSAALLGKDGTHWSFLLNTYSSLLYGNEWHDNGDGTFTSVGTERYASPLDLYLMGFYDKSEVPPVLLIDNPDIDSAKLPEAGATATGALKTITIDDVIAAEGERIPSSAASQKAFRTAFIFITRPGTFTGNEISGIENIRNAWAGKFSEMTGGKGTIADIAPSITLAIASPANGETIVKPDVNVQGTFINTTGNETGVAVNGIAASVYGNQFIANHVPLTEDANTITITAMDTAGNTASVAISVNAVTTGDYVRLTAAPVSGAAPLEVTLTVDGSFNILQSDIHAAGPVQPEFLESNPEEYRVRMTVEGIYDFTVTVTGPDGSIYQDTIAVTLLSKTQLDKLLRSRWEGMINDLSNGEAATALNYIIDVNRVPYQTMFNALIDQLPSIIATQKELNLISIGNGVAEYELVTLENGKTYSYEVIFVKGSDGLWKIQDF